ncbi:thiamine diphosphate-binding protein [Tricladium varicosporioides]|nr:thiamine diphosphate-binding protein [Hymenoscyphus varicosporioides]
MCFPANHPAYVSFQLSYDLVTTEVDTIFVLDCDVPWIPARNPPRKDAIIYHVDVDPLNATIGNSFFSSHGRWRADSYTSLTQISEHLNRSQTLQMQLQSPIYSERKKQLHEKYKAKIAALSNLAASPADGTLGIHHVGSAISAAVPSDTIFIVEAATNAMSLADQLRVSLPGTWINSAGAGLGWSGGAALGVKLAYEELEETRFVCQIAGDGVFMFSVPSSVYWTASRYGIPILTIVLNNRGWNAPRASHSLVHPNGLGITATNAQMHISFDPTPNYGGIAKAAAGKHFGSKKGGLFTARATMASELAEILTNAVGAVKEGRGALVEVVLGVDDMGETVVTKS